MSSWQNASQLNISIVGTKTIQNLFSGDFTVYIIEVTDPPLKWFVERRFSAFEDLSAKLTDYYGCTIPFPSAGFFEDRFSPQVIDKRKRNLQEFLRKIARESRYRDTREFYSFFAGNKLPLHFQAYPQQFQQPYFQSPPSPLHHSGQGVPFFQPPIDPNNYAQPNNLPVENGEVQNNDIQPNQDSDQQQQQQQQPSGENSPLIPQVVYHSSPMREAAPLSPVPPQYGSGYLISPQIPPANYVPQYPYAQIYQQSQIPYPSPIISHQQQPVNVGIQRKLEEAEKEEKSQNEKFDRIQARTEELLFQSLDSNCREDDETYKLLLREIREVVETNQLYCKQHNFMSHSLKYGDLLDAIDQRLQSTFVEQLPQHILDAASFHIEDHHNHDDGSINNNEFHYNLNDPIQIRVSQDSEISPDDREHHEKKNEEEEEVKDIKEIISQIQINPDIQNWENMYNNGGNDDVDNQNGNPEGVIDNQNDQLNMNVSPEVGLKHEDIPQDLLKATSYDKFSAILSNLEGTLYKLIDIINSTSPDDQKKIGSISRDISLFEKNLVSTGQEINLIADKSYKTLLINRLIDIQENVSDIHRTFEKRFNIKTFSAAEKATQIQIKQALKAHRAVEDSMFDL